MLKNSQAAQKVYDVGRPVAPSSGAARRPFSGTAEQMAEDIAAFARLGVSELMFDFRSESLTESLEQMERFATEIKPGAGG